MILYALSIATIDTFAVQNFFALFSFFMVPTGKALFSTEQAALDFSFVF